MIPTAEEVSSWKIEEIRERISSLTPDGWVFHFDVNSGIYFCTLKVGELTQWAMSGVDHRLLLLDAYGWLLLWQNQKVKSPVWSRRSGELTSKYVNQEWSRGPKSTEPDPVDVDPTEVNEVVKKAGKA